MLPARISEGPGKKAKCMQQRIGRILLRPLALPFLITSEILGYADEESPLDAGRLDVDPGVHGLEMIRLEKITAEESDFPAFPWFPDNAQIEPEVGRDADRVVIGRNFRLSGIEEVLNKCYFIRLFEMGGQAGGVFRKIENPGTLDFAFCLRISAPDTPLFGNPPVN